MKESSLPLSSGDLVFEVLSAETILSALKPPKHFDKAEFENYIPEKKYPSQTEALLSVQQFIEKVSSASTGSLFRKIFAAITLGNGLYLDGGFGVGKTHLLASAYHCFDGKKAYLSFQELMFLVGLQTLEGVVKSLKDYKLIIIDEFELDDPANTRISTNLLGQLFDSGVSIITSSNTPPGALGEGRFSVEDFKRELGKLTQRFVTIKIDGEDYRKSHQPAASSRSTWMLDNEELTMIAKDRKQGRIVDMPFKDFLNTLSKAHPMRIRFALEKVDTLILRNIEQISHPHEALRFVYAVDKAYDNNIALFASSNVPIEDLFHKSYFIGGDTKKYLRTMSRLGEMIHRE